MAERVEMEGMVDLRDMVDMEGTHRLMVSEMTAVASEIMMVIVAVMAETVERAETRLAETVEMATTVQTKPLLA